MTKSTKREKLLIDMKKLHIHLCLMESMEHKNIYLSVLIPIVEQIIEGKMKWSTAIENIYTATEAH